MKVEDYAANVVLYVVCVDMSLKFPFVTATAASTATIVTTSATSTIATATTA